MLASLNWVDYIIIALILFSFLAGLSRGFVKEIIALITLVLAFVLATMFATTLASAFTSSNTAQEMVSQASSTVSATTATATVSYAAIGLSFGLIFLGTIIIGSLIGFFVNLAFSFGVLGFGNRVLGGCFGILRGMVLALVLIFVLQLTVVSNQPWWQESLLVQKYQPAVAWLGNLVSPSLNNLKEKFDETLQKLQSEKQSAAPSQ